MNAKPFEMGVSENTLSRYRKVWRAYEEVLLKYGEISKDIKRRTMYQEVADMLDYDWQTVARIICVFIKNKHLQSWD